MDRPIEASGEIVADTLALADWRRRMAELYADVRRAPDAATAWALWRATRDELFARHPQSPLTPAARQAFAGLPLYPYDPAWRFSVGVEPPAAPEPKLADGGGDGAIRFHAFGRTVGLAARLGRELTLYWIDGYGGGLFLPFRDGTAGRETYAGGRYLLDAIKSADLGTDRDGRLILDFNFAYHPSCCHAAAWVCPLAPPENHFDPPVRAGERL